MAATEAVLRAHSIPSIVSKDLLELMQGFETSAGSMAAISSGSSSSSDSAGEGEAVEELAGAAAE